MSELGRARTMMWSTATNLWKRYWKKEKNPSIDESVADFEMLWQDLERAVHKTKPLVNWSEVVLKSGTTFLCNNVRVTQKMISLDYLKMVVQALGSSSVLQFHSTAQYMNLQLVWSTAFTAFFVSHENVVLSPDLKSSDPEIEMANQNCAFTHFIVYNWAFPTVTVSQCGAV